MDKMNFFNGNIFANLGKKWKRLTTYQEQTLMERFQTKPFVKMQEKSQLASSLNISERKIAMWFVDMRLRKDKRHEGLSSGGE